MRSASACEIVIAEAVAPATTRQKASPMAIALPLLDGCCLSISVSFPRSDLKRNWNRDSTLMKKIIPALAMLALVMPVVAQEKTQYKDPKDKSSYALG